MCALQKHGNTGSIHSDAVNLKVAKKNNGRRKRRRALAQGLKCNDLILKVTQAVKIILMRKNCKEKLRGCLIYKNASFHELLNK